MINSMKPPSNLGRSNPMLGMAVTMRTILIVLASLGPAMASIEIPGISTECYAKPGDVILGHVISIRNPTADEQCGDSVQAMHIEALEAFVYAVEAINADPNILPNITLGFVTLDTCDVYRMALGQSLYMIPDDNPVLPQDVAPCTGEEKHHYDIVAMIGDRRSRVVLPMALSMTSAEIPIISTYPTSDELTDDSRFGYFFSLSPPDKYQTEAILQLLAHFNWTYFTLIFSEGSYGENGGKYLQKNAGAYGICIENVFMIYADLADLNLNNAIRRLKYSTSRAVVFFIEDNDISRFFELLPEDMYDDYIWIGSDGASIRTYGRGSNGFITIHHEFGTSEPFEDYFRSLTPRENGDNPWFDIFWEEVYECEWNDSSSCSGDCLPSNDCSSYQNSSLPDEVQLYGWPVKWIDAVNALAIAMDQLVRETCPEAMMNQTLLKDCVQGPTYREYIQKVSFDGLMGHIEFDVNGEVNGHYLIKQYSAETGDNEVIGIWRKKGGLMMDEHAIDWSLYQMVEVGPTDEDVESPVLPESVCSRPCLPKQYVIQKEVFCCWECIDCRENEVVAQNGTSCRQCEENTWPDENTATSCDDIPATYLQWTSSLGIGLITVTIIGILLTILVGIAFILRRKSKLIKASSKPLMTIILLGILMAFLSVFCIHARPTRATCFLRDFGFSVSVTTIYAPLLTKTVRIYRIFAAGVGGKHNLPLISTKSQMLLTLLLILPQVLVTVSLGIARPSEPLLQMPVATEKYSELFCTLPPGALVGLLCYNLILLVICAVFGFMNRKMPENFNESWFIFISVSTTSFIWIVFLPTYFTSFYAYHRSALLSISLILNGFITIICLFVPKLYAVKFVTVNEMNIASKHTAASSVGPALPSLAPVSG